MTSINRTIRQLHLRRRQVPYFIGISLLFTLKKVLMTFLLGIYLRLNIELGTDLFCLVYLYFFDQKFLARFQALRPNVFRKTTP